MAGVFVVTGATDSQGLLQGSWRDDLIVTLGPDCVFRDIEIPIGATSPMLHRAIAASEALLVVIGRQWAGESAQARVRACSTRPTGCAPRSAALAQDKLVIPVLVGGAQMPATDALPPSVAASAGCRPRP